MKDMHWDDQVLSIIANGNTFYLKQSHDDFPWSGESLINGKIPPKYAHRNLKYYSDI